MVCIVNVQFVHREREEAIRTHTQTRTCMALMVSLRGRNRSSLYCDVPSFGSVMYRVSLGGGAHAARPYLPRAVCVCECMHMCTFTFMHTDV